MKVLAYVIWLATSGSLVVSSFAVSMYIAGLFLSRAPPGCVAAPNLDSIRWFLFVVLPLSGFGMPISIILYTLAVLKPVAHKVKEQQIMKVLAYVIWAVALNSIFASWLVYLFISPLRAMFWCSLVVLPLLAIGIPISIILYVTAVRKEQDSPRKYL